MKQAIASSSAQSHETFPVDSSTSPTAAGEAYRRLLLPGSSGRRFVQIVVDPTKPSREGPLVRAARANLIPPSLSVTFRLSATTAADTHAVTAATPLHSFVCLSFRRAILFDTRRSLLLTTVAVCTYCCSRTRSSGLDNARTPEIATFELGTEAPRKSAERYGLKEEE